MQLPALFFFPPLYKGEEKSYFNWSKIIFDARYTRIVDLIESGYLMILHIPHTASLTRTVPRGMWIELLFNRDIDRGNGILSPRKNEEILLSRL